MKKTLITIILAFLAATHLFGEEKSIPKNDSTANSSTAPEFIPNNKLLIENLINETKSKIDLDSKNLQSLTNFSKQIGDYKSKINAISTSSFNDFLNLLNTSTTKKEDYTKLSNNYFDLTYSTWGFDYGLSLRTNSDDEISDARLQFGRSVSKVTSAIFGPLNKIFSDETKKILSNDEQKIIRDVFSAAKIESTRKEILALCDAKISDIGKSIDLLKLKITNENNYISKLYEKFNEAETQINSLAIKLGLPLFCVTILLLFLGPILLRYMFKAAPETNINSQNILVEISTVLLLTMSILILGLSEKIKGDVLGTLIGGISGYVLNRIRINNQNSGEKTQ